MKKKAVFASLCIILVMASFTLAVRSAAGSTTAQIILSVNGTIANPQQRYSFMIEPLDNGSYAAINGTNNQFVSSWTSTNALTISQNVVNSLTIGGSAVWMNSQYNFAGCVNVTVSDVTLSGSGWGTVFNQTCAITPALFFVTGSNDVVEDMNLTGLHASISLGGDPNTYFYWMSNLVFSYTSNCEALNVYSAFAPESGIFAQWSTNLLIDSCYAYDNLYNDTAGSGGFLDGAYGIGGLDLYNSTITNCWVVDQGLGGNARGSGGIELDYNGIIPEGDTISFNHVITPYSMDPTLIAYGIRAKASNCTVIGNQIVLAPYSWGDGIDAVYPDTIIQGNTVQSSTMANTYGINVDYAGTSSTITGNIINNTAYGIRSQAPDSTITGNTIYEDSAGAGIVLTGTDPQNSAVSVNTIVLDSGSGQGIYLATNGNSISNNSITGAFSNSIYVISASNNTIYANSIQNSVTGIYLTTGSNFNTLDLNQINATTPISNFGNGNYQTLDILNGVPYSDAITSTVTVAENVNVGDILFQKSTGYFQANAISSTTLPTYGVYGIATQTVSAGGACPIITPGLFTDTSWSWNVDLPSYVSNSTTGGIIQTYPSSRQLVESV